MYDISSIIINDIGDIGYYSYRSSSNWWGSIYSRIRRRYSVYIYISMDYQKDRKKISKNRGVTASVAFRIVCRLYYGTVKQII